MDKIAVISDIHGNLEALKAVLKDIKERNITKIICLGDIIGKGIHFHECLNLIRENCNVILKGNYCENIIHENSNLSALEKERIAWNKKNLTKEEIDFMRTLPFCHEIYISGRLVRFFHATPKNISQVVSNLNPVDNIYEMFLPSENTNTNEVADIVVYGHIHMQFMQKMYHRTIMNTGSVGNAIDVFRDELKEANVKNTTVANYLVITGELNTKVEKEISFEFINLPYDIEKELIENEKNIEKEDYEQELKFGKYRDMKKVNDDLERVHKSI